MDVQLKPDAVVQERYAKLPKTLVTSFGKAGTILGCLAWKESGVSLAVTRDVKSTESLKALSN